MLSRESLLVTIAEMETSNRRKEEEGGRVSNKGNGFRQPKNTEKDRDTHKKTARAIYLYCCKRAFFVTFSFDAA